MIKFYHIRLFSGISLILAGALALLQTLHVLQIPGNIFGILFAALFGGLGVLFLGMITNAAEQWWAVFPGAGLLAIAATILQGILFPGLGWLGGTVFLGILGLSFVWVYLANHDRWWAIIPGGVLATLALVSLGNRFPFLDPASLLFLGMAATFFLLTFLPSGGARLTWAWIPAAAMLGMAALISFLSNHQWVYFWPLILIALGIFMTLRSFKSGHKTLS